MNATKKKKEEEKAKQNRNGMGGDYAGGVSRLWFLDAAPRSPKVIGSVVIRPCESRRYCEMNRRCGIWTDEQRQQQWKVKVDVIKTVFLGERFPYKKVLDDTPCRRQLVVSWLSC
jgi:hypothetical protein